MFAPKSVPAPEPGPDDDGIQPEQASLASWRIECLIRWGCDVYWADRFAAYDNWRDVESLLEHKCPQPLIDEIL